MSLARLLLTWTALSVVTGPLIGAFLATGHGASRPVPAPARRP